MIKLENYEVLGWEHAIRGMRNPMNSWGKSDSNYKYLYEEGVVDGECIGPNDYELMMKLAKGGPVHAKYRRMIIVYVDITAPLYWWKEFDTYKVGTVANSCSTMHKIHEKEFTIDDFSHEHLFDLTNEVPEHPDLLLDVSPYQDGSVCFSPSGMLVQMVVMLNMCRERYLEIDEMIKSKHGDVPFDEAVGKRKSYWWQMIQLLPTSYNQKRTVMLNYEVLTGMYKSRKNHKLDEWREFCKWIESLPYSEIITGTECTDEN